MKIAQPLDTRHATCVFGWFFCCRVFAEAFMRYLRLCTWPFMATRTRLLQTLSSNRSTKGHTQITHSRINININRCSFQLYSIYGLTSNRKPAGSLPVSSSSESTSSLSHSCTAAALPEAIKYGFINSRLDSGIRTNI